jgi:lipoprotein-anchoring transpeptidase ErfK/SrfK
VSVPVRPALVASFTGTSSLGGPLALVASIRPASAGVLRVRIWKAGRLVTDVQKTGSARIRLDTSKAVGFRAHVTAVPAEGYVRARRTAETIVVVPRLQLGATGPSVAALERRLAEMHYALRGVDSSFGFDTYEAVLAFQKVHGLARTGRIDPSLWRRIFTASTPSPRHRSGSHIEVDKTRQVLFEVRDGKVALVVHVSTGATGNTPLGVWRVYRRVAGFDWVLYYPSYFLRGFAVHGYPSVPPYPASHGCVRIPMWVAQRVYSSISLGEPVYVDA